MCGPQWFLLSQTPLTHSISPLHSWLLKCFLLHGIDFFFCYATRKPQEHLLQIRLVHKTNRGKRNIDSHNEVHVGFIIENLLARSNNSSWYWINMISFFIVSTSQINHSCLVQYSLSISPFTCCCLSQIFCLYLQISVLFRTEQTFLHVIGHNKGTQTNMHHDEDAVCVCAR